MNPDRYLTAAETLLLNKVTLQGPEGQLLELPLSPRYLSGSTRSEPQGAWRWS